MYRQRFALCLLFVNKFVFIGLVPKRFLFDQTVTRLWCCIVCGLQRTQNAGQIYSWLQHSRSFLVCSCVPKQFFYYRLNSFCLWDCARAGPAEFRHHFKAFLFQNSALFTNKSTKENLLTETENSKFEIQNTNPDRMQQQQSGMFSSVFILNALFNLSDNLSTFRASLARPVCELYTVFKAKQVSGVQLLYFLFKRNVLFAHSLPWYRYCSVLFFVGILRSSIFAS